MNLLITSKFWKHFDFSYFDNKVFIRDIFEGHGYLPLSARKPLQKDFPDILTKAFLPIVDIRSIDNFIGTARTVNSNGNWIASYPIDSNRAILIPFDSLEGQFWTMFIQSTDQEVPKRISISAEDTFSGVFYHARYCEAWKGECNPGACSDCVSETRDDMTGAGGRFFRCQCND